MKSRRALDPRGDDRLPLGGVDASRVGEHRVSHSGIPGLRRGEPRIRLVAPMEDSFVEFHDTVAAPLALSWNPMFLLIRHAA